MEVVRKALHGVTQEGTSTRVFLGASYPSGGKTGTAQAVGIRQDQKYDKSKMADYLRDHSLYTAFAPVDNPQVALAVIVENSGFGAEAAAPIARRVLDFVLTGRYPNAEDIALVQKGQAGPPVGTPRLATEVPLMPFTPGAVTTAGGDAAAAPAAPASQPAPAASAPGGATAAPPAKIAQAPAPTAPTEAANR